MASDAAAAPAAAPGCRFGFVMETHLGRGSLGELWVVASAEGDARAVVEFADSGSGGGGLLGAGAHVLFAPQPHPGGPQFVGGVQLAGNLQALLGWTQFLCAYAYRLDACLGRGGFGEVWRALKTDVCLAVAVKFVAQGGPGSFAPAAACQPADRQVKLLRREILNHAKLGAHRHIVQFYEIIWNPGSVPAIVMEYAGGGTLLSLIDARGRTLAEPEAAHFFRQLVAGVEHMHAAGVVNRDIKLCNCLLDEGRAVLKMCDFGLSKDAIAESMPKSEVGSFHSKPPEVIEAPAGGGAGGERPYDGCAADIWCCGVLLYCLIAGQYPFQRAEDEADPRMKAIVRSTREMHRILADPPDVFRHPAISDTAWDLITAMLTRDPAARIGLPAIKAHPFFWLGTEAAAPAATPASSMGMASSAAPSSASSIMMPTQSELNIDQVFKEARPGVPFTPGTGDGNVSLYRPLSMGTGLSGDLLDMDIPSADIPSIDGL